MNVGAFEHEEEILLYDGTQFTVLSVLDEEYQRYEFQGDEEDPDNGLKCVIVNDQEDEDGCIKVHFLEG